MNRPCQNSVLSSNKNGAVYDSTVGVISRLLQSDVAKAGGGEYRRQAPLQPGCQTIISTEINAVALYQCTKTWKVGAGYGHLFADGFLKEAKAGFGYTYPYVMTAGSF